MTIFAHPQKISIYFPKLIHAQIIPIYFPTPKIFLTSLIEHFNKFETSNMGYERTR